MAQLLRCVIELGGSAAGLVVEEGKKFRFFASDKRYGALERRLFSSPRHAEESCRRLQKSVGRPALSRRVIVIEDGTFAALAPGRPATIADVWAHLAERQEAWRALIEASQPARPPATGPGNDNRRKARTN